MGCSSSNNGFNGGKRKLNVKKANSRVTTEEYSRLKQFYERIQRGSTVDFCQFRTEICSPHLPPLMMSMLFVLIASPIGFAPMHSYPRMSNNLYDMSFQIFYNVNDFLMKFEDLLALYAIFKNPQQDEMAQLSFWMIYYTRQMRIYYNDCRPLAGMVPNLPSKFGQQQPVDIEERKRDLQIKHRIDQIDSEEHIMEPDISYFFQTVLGIDNQARMDDFRKNLRQTAPVQGEIYGIHAYNLGIWKATFKNALYLKSSLFSWLPDLMGGFGADSMNIPMGEGKMSELENSDRRLTMGFAMKATKDAEKQGLTNEEVANIRQFYAYEIKGKDAKNVLLVFQRMFRDIKNSKLRKYLLDSCSQVTALNFSFLCNLALVVCREVPLESRVDFLFDVFTRQKPLQNLKRTALKDVLEIFKLDVRVFPNPVFVTRDDFISSLNDNNIDVSQLYEAKPMMTALMCLIPGSYEEERAAIRAVLNNNTSLETYIYENLPDEQTFYVLDKKFWDDWTASIGFYAVDNPEFSMKVSFKSSIKNEKLLEDKHEYRLKDSVYDEDFILLPKYAFFPLNAWYSCDKIITREVISWKHQQVGGRMSQQSRQSGKMMQMSSQKFYNPKEETFDMDMQRRVADWIYELEVYPKVVYLGQISGKGEKLHQKALINRKFDKKYLKSHSSKSADSLPFKELQLSKKTTLQSVLNQAAKTYGENAKKGRLHIEESILVGVQLLVTLEDYGIQEGQLIYVEFATQSNEWPSDKSAAQGSDMSKQQKLGQNTAGLVNLGNTCYMNSALQCIANLKPVHEYFIENHLYMKQINMKNPLGHQGDLVSAFAELMKQMWQREGFVAPREFKIANAKCAGQFEGNEQQDSQEYIAFLVDGLHEELNLRMKKPYIENPESENRQVMELGLEFHANSLRRDWSFFFFTFYGLSRSSINCVACNRESITFETFSSISLPLPEPAHTVISIMVHRLPNKVREQLGKKGEQLVGKGGDMDSNTSGFMQLESERDFESGFSSAPGAVPTRMPHRHSSVNKGRINSSESTRDRRQTQLFTESFTYNTNDMPIHVCLKVDNDIMVKDIQTKIAQIREVNVDPKFEKTELILFFLTEWNNTVKYVMNPLCKLSQYRQSADTVIYAVEVVKKKARDELAQEIEGIISTDNAIDLHLKTWFQGYQVGQEQERQVQKEFGGRKEDLSSQGTTNRTGRSGFHPGSVDMYMIVSGLTQYTSRFKGEHGEPINLHLLPSSIIVTLYPRRFVGNSNPFNQVGSPNMVFRPVLITVPPFSSSRMLYEEVWGIIQTQLKQNCELRDPNYAHWWQDKCYDSFNEDNLVSDVMQNGRKKTLSLNASLMNLTGNGRKRDFKPFIIRRVKSDGQSCSKCHWRKRCAGCPLIPNEEPTSLVNQPFFTIDWHPTLLQEQYNPTTNELIEHTSVSQLTSEKLNEQSSITSLEDCLFKFHKREELENTLHCRGCAGQQLHTKRLDIFQPPPVMIIQLKRFKQIENMDRWRKLSSVVDFPIFNLDMSGYLVDKNHVHNTLGLESKYDLHGYVNHMGTLSNGHYTATLRNPFNRKWYVYDDHHVSEVSETGLMKEHAYLLFYVRKDLQHKTLRDSFPNIENDLFLGKPVKTAEGKDAYVIEMPEAQTAEATAISSHKQSAEPKTGGSKVVAGGVPVPAIPASSAKGSHHALASLKVKLAHKVAAETPGDPVLTVKVEDLAEEIDKEIIVYNQSELNQVNLLKLKRLQTIQAQKSGRKIKQHAVASKKKQTSCCMCMRSKATVANKESEEASENEEEPLQNSYYNLSNNVSDRDVHSSLNREKRRQEFPVKKVSEGTPPKKAERKRKGSVPGASKESPETGNASSNLNTKPQRTRTPNETEDVEVTRPGSKPMKASPSQDKVANKISEGTENQEKQSKTNPDETNDNTVKRARSKTTFEKADSQPKLSTGSKSNQAWMENTDQEKET